MATELAGLRQTQHLNFLGPSAYRLQIDKLKIFNHCITAVNLPWLQVGKTDMPNPFIKIPVPGTHWTFGVMDVNFNVDEELISYRELYTWAIEIGKPDNFPQRQEMNIARSDGSLTILTSAKNPFLRFKIYDIILTGIGQMQFDSAVVDNNPVTCTASFAFRKFEPELITSS